MYAAFNNKKTIDLDDIAKALMKTFFCLPERLEDSKKDNIKEIAYHEAGHAIVASVLPNADPVHKVSIVARGRAGGYTLKLPLEERKLTNRAQYRDDIAMSMGGYAAEKLIFDDVTTGPSNDLQVSTKLARNMVTRWGMSDEIGPIALESDSSETMFGQGTDRREHSERIEALIDDEVSRIMREGMETARKTLNEHKDALVAVADALLDQETLEQDDYDTIIKKYGITPKKKEESKKKKS
jgi:cell division protease FtsH